MPKRRVTAKRKAAIARWQAAGAAARHRAQVGFSHPTGKRGQAWPKPGTRGAYGVSRSHKLGGKAYQQKTPGSLVISDEAQAIQAGKGGFRDQLAADMNHQGPAKIPRIRSSWRSRKPSEGAKRQQAQIAERAAKAAKRKVVPGKVHGSGTGLQAWARYKD